MTPDPAAARRAVLARVVLLVVVSTLAGVLAGGLVVPTALALGDVVDHFGRQIASVPPLPADFERPPERSVVLARDGTELAEIFYEENRISVPLEQIPLIVRQAVIATEDADFYQHRGINHRAILRAALRNVRAGGIEQGGSTITQQYIKIAAGLAADRSLDRKIKEAVWAVELEKRLSKDEILERYLNRAYFGNGVYGIATAAEYYFGKDVAELTLPEAALLAGLIRAPERNDPIDEPDAARARRNVVLDQMVAAGFITRAQAEQAKQAPLAVDPHPLEQPTTPFFVDWVTRLLVNEATARGLGTQLDALQAMGATPEERIATVFQGGIRIYTTLDPTFQRYAEEAIAEYVNDPLYDPLAAIVSVEPGTGAVRAMAIGPKQFGECAEPVAVAEDGRLLCDRTKFNPVVPADAGSSRTGRQPGSSFKPFVIAAALESGFPPGWQIDATGPQTIDPTKCPNPGGPWRVNNSGGNGLRDMYTGIAGSSNVFHARLIAEVGPQKVADMAWRLGIRSRELEPVCAMALGGEEVFPLEHATAYATLANRGVYCAPYVIERIEDRDGNLLYEHTPDCERVLDARIADRVVDILKGPVGPGGTAPVANLGRWPTRGKTGTTDDNVDAWFVGFIRQLATAAWVGFENGIERYATLEQAAAACPSQHDGRGRDDLEGPVCLVTRYLRNVTIGGRHYARVFGGTVPAPMWKAYMERVAQHFDPEGFPAPGPMPTTTVPDLAEFVGEQLELVTDRLEEVLDAAQMNLELETVPHYAPPGTIVGQRPEPGTTVPAGNALFLQISDGTAPAPEVPDVRGLPEEQATEQLTELGYEVRVLRREVDDPDEDGIVLDQTPKPGARLAPGDGARVTLLVGEYTPPEKGKPTPTPTTSPSPSPSPSPSSSPSPSP